MQLIFFHMEQNPEILHPKVEQVYLHVNRHPDKVSVAGHTAQPGRGRRSRPNKGVQLNGSAAYQKVVGRRELNRGVPDLPICRFYLYYIGDYTI